MGRAWVALGTCLLLAGVNGCGDDSGGSFVFEEEFEFSELSAGLTTLDVEADNGAVVIHGGETDHVEIVASRYVRATLEAEGRLYANDVLALVRRDGDTPVVRTVRPTGDQPSFVEESRIQYEVVVPAGMELRVKAENGAVEVADMDADVRVTTSNGDVTVEDVQGAVSVETSNGLVSATMGNVERDMDMRTSNGRIDVLIRGACLAPVSLESSNGAISLRVRELLEPADLRTSNGSLTLVVESTLEADIEARTSNGPIEVRLPFEASIHLAANSSGGLIDTDWGRSDESLEVEVHGGDYEVNLETSAGTIRVTQG